MRIFLFSVEYVLNVDSSPSLLVVIDNRVILFEIRARVGPGLDLAQTWTGLYDSQGQGRPGLTCGQSMRA